MHPMFFSVVRTFIFEERVHLLRYQASRFETKFEGKTYRVIPNAFIALVATAVSYFLGSCIMSSLVFRFTLPCAISKRVASRASSPLLGIGVLTGGNLAISSASANGIPVGLSYLARRCTIWQGKSKSFLLCHCCH